MNYFFDVGAGRGEIFTLDDVVPPAQRKDTALVCIEPSPRNFVHLMEQAEKHGGEWHSVLLWNAALGGETKTCASLHLKTDHSGDSLLARWATNETHPFMVCVEVLSARSVLAGVLMNPQNAVTLKLDCEGSETGILRELLGVEVFLRRAPKVLVEWHDADPAARSFLEREYRERGIELEPWNH
jgi:FkbM family methyltransferase